MDAKTLQGHREDDLDHNRKNYLDLLELITVHDIVVVDKLHNGLGMLHTPVQTFKTNYLIYLEI